MKQLVLFGLLFSLTATVFAQGNKLTKSFLNDVFKKDSIKIVDQISNYEYEYLVKSIESLRKHLLNGELEITTAECDYLKLKVANMRSFRWKSNMFNKAQIISLDTITSIFESNSKGWPYFNKIYGTGFFHCSYPIFFRNNRLCIFYKGYSCGELCGNGEVTIYVKRNGNWIPEINLLSWVS